MQKSLLSCAITALVLIVLTLGISDNAFSGSGRHRPDYDPANRNDYFASLPKFELGTPLKSDEMRIWFGGTTCIPMLNQAAVSVLVELGNGDHFMFDAGTGVATKYYAMGHYMDKMNKIFLAHLHSDHIGELPFIFGFGPYFGRTGPLYIWGPGRSNFTWTSPDGIRTRGPFNDGTRDAMDALQAFTVWHTESQSFIPTTYSDYQVPTWCTWADCSKTDAYEIVTKELDWKNTGYVDKDGNPVPGPNEGTAVENNIAYNDGAVKITHFPAVHTRAGSVSYKLEWNGLSMIYAGDTLPNYYMTNNAEGVDVLVHEIVMPASVWNQKMGVSSDEDEWAQMVQDSSHTPQKALGYMLNQLKQKKKAPRLAVATHFQATDDTIESAFHDIRLWYPRGDVAIASDFMVVTVSKKKIHVERAIVSEYAWPQAVASPYSQPEAPKYWAYTDDTKTSITGDPTAQLDPTEDAQVINPDLYNAR